METLQAPIREIEARFTRSEMIIMGWRSSESYYDMTRDAPAVGNKEQTDEGTAPGIPGDVPERFINEQGEFDMRRMTGKEALSYFASRGVRIPVIMR